jgi:hypothetical protein
MVTFVYPCTTAVGDSKGQKQRIAAIAQELSPPWIPAAMIRANYQEISSV